jgi:Ca-activated chloride channel family protein
LVRIALKGRELASDARPPANLVFLIDVSGSMGRSLGLVKFALRELLGRLRPDDRIAIVTFENEAKLELRSTPVERADEIRTAIDRLAVRSGTNGGAGIKMAYEVARERFQAEGINRVILCTDGMFNIGVTQRADALSLIRESASSRVYLTVLGFREPQMLAFMSPRMRSSTPALLMRNDMLEMLADNGNGVYGFVDSAAEARKILVEQVEGTLATIAKDVKLQVEFNPSRVAAYRLIGYENRALTKRDFTDEAADAGEVAAGHSVTALYEIEPKSGNRPKKGAVSSSGAGSADDLLTLRIRYQTPEGKTAPELTFPLADGGMEFEDAAAVAAWGILLREGGRSDLISFSDVEEWARQGLGEDAAGYRAEFLELVDRARSLKRPPVVRELR